MPFIHKIFSSRARVSDPEKFIGERGRIWYSEHDGKLRISDEVTPGGLPITTIGNLTPGGDGVSIRDAEVINGNLIITLTDSTSIDVGRVVGEKGDIGSTGNTGAAGTSVSSVSINNFGNLLITLTDSTVIDVGYVIGPAGANGTPGINGIDGVDGLNGANGVSVVSSSINNSGNLILSLSDGSSIDAGKTVPDIQIVTDSGQQISNTITLLGGDMISTRVESTNTVVDLEVTFENLSKNLRSYPYTISRTDGQISSVSYTLPNANTITKTLNYSSGVVSNIVISGTNLSNVYIKELNYVNSVLSGATYRIE